MHWEEQGKVISIVDHSQVLMMDNPNLGYERIEYVCRCIAASRVYSTCSTYLHHHLKTCTHLMLTIPASSDTKNPWISILRRMQGGMVGFFCWHLTLPRLASQGAFFHCMRNHGERQGIFKSAALRVCTAYCVCVYARARVCVYMSMSLRVEEGHLTFLDPICLMSLHGSGLTLGYIQSGT